MDTEKIKAVSGLAKKLTVNLESEHAKDVAKSYIVFKFIEDQIANLIWTPFALAAAYALYAGGKWIIGQI